MAPRRSPRKRPTDEPLQSSELVSSSALQKRQRLDIPSGTIVTRVETIPVVQPGCSTDHGYHDINELQMPDDSRPVIEVIEIATKIMDPDEPDASEDASHELIREIVDRDERDASMDATNGLIQEIADPDKHGASKDAADGLIEEIPDQKERDAAKDAAIELIQDIEDPDERDGPKEPEDGMIQKIADPAEPDGTKDAHAVIQNELPAQGDDEYEVINGRYVSRSEG